MSTYFNAIKRTSTGTRNTLNNALKNATNNSIKNAVNNAVNNDIVNNAVNNDIVNDAVNNVANNSDDSWFSLTPFNIIMLIIVLAFLGFNLFKYLGLATEESVNIFSPLLKALGISTLDTTQNLVNVTSDGAKHAVDITKGIATDAINVVKPGADSDFPSNDTIGNMEEERDKVKNAPAVTNTLLDNAIHQQRQTSRNEWEADSSTSNTQTSMGANKSGYCYIGSDKGIRSCIKVNEMNECLSGKVFNSMEICQNPGLR